MHDQAEQLQSERKVALEDVSRVETRAVLLCIELYRTQHRATTAKVKMRVSELEGEIWSRLAQVTESESCTK